MVVWRFLSITGDHFQLALPFINADNFQIFVGEFSNINPKELKIMMLDSRKLHKTKQLIILENIVVVFLSPYRSELGHAEKILVKYKEFS